jgi:putative SOS response-associated peptidase YedK
MCGRFTLASPSEILAALFGVESGDWDEPKYNIAPQTRIVTVGRAGGRRVGQSLLWGALNPRDGKPLINARSETVATSPLFSRAFSVSRILVPADGFFEWTKEGSARRGHYFRQPGSGPFGFGGIAVAPATGTGPDAERTAVILTTAASESVKAVHDRMPLLVPPEDFDLWLDRDARPKAVLDVLARGAHTPWTSHPVGPSVNNVRNDTPENIRRAEPAPEAQGRLF